LETSKALDTMWRKLAKYIQRLAKEIFGVSKGS